MVGVECTVHLIALLSGASPTDFIKDLESKSSSGSKPYIIKGRPHGWVHKPHKYNVDQLTGQDWNLFLLSRDPELPAVSNDLVTAHISIQVSIPREQYDKFLSEVGKTPSAIPDTPPLPAEWIKSGGIPPSKVTTTNTTLLKPGELRLDRAMADFLSDALPPTVSGRPVSLFNLFRYPNGDSKVHEHYMAGFKEKFGPAAGARVKFMGPVRSVIGPSGEVERIPSAWQDANLVQYDSILHYAYMLSTDVYQKLNKEKMEGLEDTCILCVSEAELAG